ncbi:hypothetical protein RB195_002819 [Necator americanus]|uniref:Uncharacterized protein n=1 Tax=Necator americanus TaxID=51031 RepID=A0ABR1DNM7_NECAM
MAVNISTLSNNLPRVGRLSEDSSGRGEGYVPIAPPAAKDGSFWLWYTVNMTLATVCLVLNALLSTAMIVGREKTFKVSNYVFYAIPLISSVFYLAVFNSLRHQRADAVSEKTKMLLDKAERCSLKQGTWILTGYLVRLLVMSRTVVPLQLNAL